MTPNLFVIIGSGYGVLPLRHYPNQYWLMVESLKEKVSMKLESKCKYFLSGKCTWNVVCKICWRFAICWNSQQNLFLNLNISKIPWHNTKLDDKDKHCSYNYTVSWWHHQMERFPVLLDFVRGIHWSLEFFDLRLNKRLNKQSRGWWFEAPWCSL